MTKHSNYQKQKQQGFTLLELLVVVSILAAVAMTTGTVLDRLDERTDAQLTQVEMAQVAKAVRQFRADTGYFPKEGPFDIDKDSLSGVSCETWYDSLLGAEHPAASFDVDQLPIYAPSDCNAKLSWFYHAANLSQLTAVGIKAEMESIMPWNALAARGWRGPYLDSSGEGFVDVGFFVEDGEDLDASDGNDAPDNGSLLTKLPAILVGAEKKPEGDYFVTRRASSGEKLKYARRPIMMMLERDTNRIVERVVLISLGKNGLYDGYSASPDCEASGDDQVICIYPD